MVKWIFRALLLAGVIFGVALGLVNLNYALTVERGETEEFRNEYVRLREDWRSPPAARAFARYLAAEPGSSHHDRYELRIKDGKSPDFANAYLSRYRRTIEHQDLPSTNYYGYRSHYYAHYFEWARTAGKSEDFADQYARLMETGNSREYAWRFTEAILDDNLTPAQAHEIAAAAEFTAAADSARELVASAILAAFSTTERGQGQQRAAEVYGITAAVGAGNLSRRELIALIEDFSPESKAKERLAAAAELAKISEQANNTLTSEQSLKVANQLTKLATGHAADPEKRIGAAREIVSLAERGDLTPDKATELMNVIAPEWSIGQRKEALGFLAWQLSEGDWSRQNTQRAAEEGYTLLTGGELRLDRRFQAGVDIVGEGLKRYGGEQFDDGSVDQATSLISLAATGDLDVGSVTQILAEIDSQEDTSSRYSSKPQRKLTYNEAYHKKRLSFVYTFTPDEEIEYRSKRYAANYREKIDAGRSHLYARVYAHHRDIGDSREEAEFYAEQKDRGRSNEYAKSYAYHRAKGESHTYAAAHASLQDLDEEDTPGSHQAYALKIDQGFSHQYARAYSGMDRNDSDSWFNDQTIFFHREYAERIMEGYQRGTAQLYAQVYDRQISDNKPDEFAEAYARDVVSEYNRLLHSGSTGNEAALAAEALAEENLSEYLQLIIRLVTSWGKTEDYAHAFATQILQGNHAPYAHNYAESIAAGRTERYAAAYAQRLAESRSTIFAASYAAEIDNGKSPVYAETYAGHVNAGGGGLYSRFYSWVIDLTR